MQWVVCLIWKSETDALAQCWIKTLWAPQAHVFGGAAHSILNQNRWYCHMGKTCKAAVTSRAQSRVSVDRIAAMVTLCMRITALGIIFYSLCMHSPSSWVERSWAQYGWEFRGP